MLLLRANCLPRAEALQLVVSECKPKAKIVDLCEKGDAFIREYVFLVTDRLFYFGILNIEEVEACHGCN